MWNFTHQLWLKQRFLYLFPKITEGGSSIPLHATMSHYLEKKATIATWTLSFLILNPCLASFWIHVNIGHVDFCIRQTWSLSLALSSEWNVYTIWSKVHWDCECYHFTSYKRTTMRPTALNMWGTKVVNLWWQLTKYWRQIVVGDF